MQPTKPPIEMPEVDPQVVLARLWQFGYFEDEDVDEFEEIESLDIAHRTVESATARYQSYFSEDLRIDGQCGEVTITHLMRPRCAFPDFAPLNKRENALAQWPRSCMKNITTSHRIDNLRGITSQQIHQAWLACLKETNRVCGMVTSYQRDMSTAKVYAHEGHTDSGVLAWSYLPNNHCSSRLEQRYGTRWTWNEHLFRSTVLHELGHAWGLGHDNDRRSVMYPSGPNADVWHEIDIRKLVARYGSPDITEPPDPPPGEDRRIVLATWQQDNRNFEVAEIVKATQPRNPWGI